MANNRRIHSFAIISGGETRLKPATDVDMNTDI
jgi:hypothetical protein